MIERVKSTLAGYTDVPVKKMTLESTLMGDLGMSSFDLINVVVAFEDEFDIQIEDDEIREIQTLGDIVRKLEEKCAENLAPV